MQSPVLLQKVLDLEKEILELKSQFPPESNARKAFNEIKGGVDGVLSYWVPLALIVGLIVNWWFGVGFFENIKNIGINKTSSDYYRRIGDKLISHAEFAAAAESFEKALEINSNNIGATHGLMKAQVLQAVGNSQSFNPIVVEDKLTYLRDIFGKDDYILLYWEGILRRHLSSTPQDLQIPEQLFTQSINANGSFPGSHLELGNTYMLSGDIDKAVDKFQHVIKLDPRFAGALSNLGYCNLVLSNFRADETQRQEFLRTAAEQLERARSSSPLPETDLRLGDTYLFLKQYRPARVSHQNALDTLERAGDQKTLQSLEVLFVFPPTMVNEDRKRGPAIKVKSTAELKSLVLYSLSIDYAAMKDFTSAQKYFNEAGALDARKQFSPLIAHQINAFLRIPSIPSDTRAWLLSHMKEACNGVEACLPETINELPKERKKK
jgi:tetratricopeptide (TPR) repeat protein